MEAVVTKPVRQTHLPDDYGLVCQAVRGNQRAYAHLMDRYRESLYRTVYKMVPNKDDAEDLTLEAFGKAFHHLHRYRPQYAFSTWLFRIAINNCIDYIRKKRLQVLSIDDPIEAHSEQEFSSNIRFKGFNPEEQVIRSQRQKLMHRLIGQLNDKYRIMIQLRYFEEYSYEEIAHELDLPLGTVKAQLHRAKEALYERLSQPGASAYLEHNRRK